MAKPRIETICITCGARPGAQCLSEVEGNPCPDGLAPWIRTSDLSDEEMERIREAAKEDPIEGEATEAKAPGDSLQTKPTPEPPAAAPLEAPDDPLAED